jgi:hypothetical protein
MSILKKCILKNEIFEVDYFEGEHPPKNTVLTDVQGNLNIYQLTNGVEIEIVFEWFQNSSYKINFCLFKHSNIVIKEIEERKINFQSIANLINKYNSYTEAELKDLVKLAEQKIKPQLQVEIEELNAEKDALESKIHTYKQIDKKYEEIKKLLSELEE